MTAHLPAFALGFIAGIAVSVLAAFLITLLPGFPGGEI